MVEVTKDESMVDKNERDEAGESKYPGTESDMFRKLAQPLATQQNSLTCTLCLEWTSAINHLAATQQALTSKYISQYEIWHAAY